MFRYFILAFLFMKFSGDKEPQQVPIPEPIQLSTNIHVFPEASETAPTVIPSNLEEQKARIQIALLLDTSSSMDGLIDQAKSQLWKMVNELASTKKYGQHPDIELALYEYGNSSLSISDGYIKRVSALSRDLDLISEKLFQLNTGGGDEYCGQVVSVATKDLEWSKDDADLKLIIIAGNEPYTQGPVDYIEACKQAKKKGIIINTIHCGDYQEGVTGKWEDGATCSGGKYMNINQDDKVVHIPTPYDDQIINYNEQLNKTYIGYGGLGVTNIERQETEDANASTYSKSNMATRAVSKSKGAYYNSNWDLVDALEEDDKILSKITTADLPDEMKKMSKDEQKKYIESKQKERLAIQAKIKELDKKRKVFIEKEQAKTSETKTLDNIMMDAIREQATEKSFSIEK